MALALPKLRRRRDPEGTMSVVQHLEEFRRRLFYAIIAWIVLACVAYAFYDQILGLLRLPLEEGGRIGDVVVDDLYVSGIGTAFFLKIKVSAFAGLVLAWPVIFWQIWRFITPGLRKNEKRWAVGFVAASVLLFALGAFIAYVLLPVGINWLLAFAVEPGLTPLLQFNDYINFVTLMILAFGISFEFPLILVFLAAVGMIGSDTLRGKRRWAFLGMFIIAAVATPSGDPLSQIMLAVPLYLLYEGALLFIRFVLRK
ncbi:MAG: twin-arginine translocase subunit TatC [Actinomycetota bacterium]